MLLAANFYTSVGLAFPLWTGLHAHGSVTQGDNHLGYDLYTVNPTTDSTNLGLGARAWYRLGDRMTFGTSYQIGKELSAVYQSYGADFNGKFGALGLTAEYAHSVISQDRKGLETYYAQPYYEFFGGKFLVYGVADYLDNPVWLTVVAPMVADAYKRWDVGGGLNWIPRPTTRFRLGYIDHDYVGANSSPNGQKRNYREISASAGISF
jgi:hypothetical protein